jgi:LPXTG-motif cell wall-anchored protein
VWHRNAPSEWAGETGGWAIAARVPGLESVSGLVGVVADGAGGLHVMGGDPGGATLAYSAWDGERWTSVDSAFLGVAVEGIVGVGGATRPEGGTLAAAALASYGGADGSAPVIVLSQREIEPVDVWPAVSPEPAGMPAAEPTVVSTGESGAGTLESSVPTAAPTVAPGMAGGPVETGSSMTPLIVGGGLGAVAVVGLVALWSARRRRRDKHLR